MTAYVASPGMLGLLPSLFFFYFLSNKTFVSPTHLEKLPITVFHKIHVHAHI